MTLPKILVSAPVSFFKDYAREQWIKTVKSLTYPNYDVFASDNSSDITYHAKNFHLKGIDCGWVNPKGKRNNQYITESQNQIVAKVLNEGYDYLLFLEEDIVPPPDIIEQLLAYDYELVTTDYFINEGSHSQLLRMEMEDNCLGTYTNRMMNETEIWIEYGRGKTRSWFCAFGCTLIHQSILERFPLYIQEDDELKSHADTIFSFQLFEAGIKPIIHPIIVEHNNSDWAKIKDYV